MKTIWMKGALAAAALMLGATIATAKDQPARSWTGLWLSAHGGASNVNTDVGLFGMVGIDGLGGSGFLYGADAGYNYQFPGTAIVVGIVGGYTQHDADFVLSVPGGALKMGPKSNWSVGGRLGFAVGDSHVYGLVAYSELKGEASITGLGTAEETFKGAEIGGGIEHRLAGGMFLGLEYRYGKYDAKSYGGGLLTIEPETHATKARIGFKF